MTENEADLRALLRELDDPDWLEWPQHYDRAAQAARLGELVTRLDGDFATRCEAGTTQDSSEFGRVVVPGGATACGTRIVVCLSNFGSLAVICAENPGAFFGTEDARAEGALDDADLATATRALVDLGYVVVPEELMESDYDGPSQLPCHVQRGSWSHRFFGTYFGPSLHAHPR
ncbi:hypothetical protein [Streptomyces sp. BE303]|uniref:hypothetical protein n=1 Tax=Streptomyces sp. BE303 TaxID=3002528 RepID=UPI002E786FBF|nr:hypothetical protein [Streptomyces sp. BE303]MED7947485.1 hypothetical protein [Streptomyces sp. BE303]